MKTSDNKFLQKNNHTLLSNHTYSSFLKMEKYLPTLVVCFKYGNLQRSKTISIPYSFFKLVGFEAKNYFVIDENFFFITTLLLSRKFVFSAPNILSIILGTLSHKCFTVQFFQFFADINKPCSADYKPETQNYSIT